MVQYLRFIQNNVFKMEPYIFSFGFPTSATTVTSGVTHLSNQKYDICIRRAKSYCYICYSTWKAGTAVIAQGSFGLRYDSFLLLTA